MECRILPKERDPRLITVRRGGTLTDEHHKLLADWASRAQSTCCTCSRFINQVIAGRATPSTSVEPESAARFVWVTHAERLSRRIQRRAGCLIQRSSLPCRRARRLWWLMSPPMTWALPRRHQGGRRMRPSRPRWAGSGQRTEWQRVHLPGDIRELVLDDQQRRSAICCCSDDRSETCYSSASPRRGKRSARPPPRVRNEKVSGVPLAPQIDT